MSKLAIVALLVLLFAVPQCLAAQTLTIYSEDSFVDLDGSAAIPIYANVVSSDSTETFALGALDFEFRFTVNSCSYVYIDSVTTTTVTSHFLLEMNSPDCFSADVAMTGVPAVVLTTTPQRIATLHLTYRNTSRPEAYYWRINAYSDSLELINVPTASFNIDVGCIKGDVLYGDGITSGDALKALYGTLGTLELIPIEVCSADMNSDETLDIGDVILVLQRAVGMSVTMAESSTSPVVALRTSNGSGEVRLQLNGVAGTMARFEFDPGDLRFVSVAQNGPSSLVATHEPSPGTLLIGLANTSIGIHDLNLEFELLAPETELHLASTQAYGSHGEPLETTIESSTVTLRAEEEATDIPASRATSLAFLGATPNPFNPRTTLRFSAPSADPIRVRVINSAGRRVFEDSVTPAASGFATLVWNGKDATGRPVGSGVYYVEARQQALLTTGSIVLVR